MRNRKPKPVIAFMVLVITDVIGQPDLKVEVSADTIMPGEMVKVSYIIENGEGMFEGPDLERLPLVSGPNMASSMMVRNGKKSSSMTYSYIFIPQSEDHIRIPPAYYKTGNDILTFEPVNIMVSTKTNDTVEKKKKNNQAPIPAREKQKI